MYVYTYKGLYNLRWLLAYLLIILFDVTLKYTELYTIYIYYLYFKFRIKNYRFNLEKKVLGDY